MIFYFWRGASFSITKGLRSLFQKTKKRLAKSFVVIASFSRLGDLKRKARRCGRTSRTTNNKQASKFQQKKRRKKGEFIMKKVPSLN
ncbi:MAG: hypothetical protein COX62_05335 [Deltaproteobacteria bacterium CG_4_10_14_0_2_um_filter_43_8]|nr:MAG: hypothetical protein COV43_08705 [Deltaproteobacteria bacterium CG11_big_fil_rev_8_21_14_0_20_42_23]PJA20109.1 MAG: hypothetical protein COX62_05335 [Deltaproteobacteria bacterium CG_4_10_14_0_2_um_filter_43_8]PJC64986.1 MAG: hypothetical protein CO021_01485 [Deltaproteobacteria bacterium CG_4_9_14_0_2_um_filter_42_21]